MNQSINPKNSIQRIQSKEFNSIQFAIFEVLQRKWKNGINQSNEWFLAKQEAKNKNGMSDASSTTFSWMEDPTHYSMSKDRNKSKD